MVGLRSLLQAIGPMNLFDPRNLQGDHLQGLSNLTSKSPNRETGVVSGNQPNLLRCNRPQWLLGVVFCTVCLLYSHPAHSVDHFVTIGGGYDPKGNQASMEANVQFFQTLLADRYQPGQYQHHIFFSDGRDPQDDVQTAPAADQLSESLRIIAELFDWDTQPISYRDHEIPGVTASNRASEIKLGMENLCTTLTDQDRLFIYVTAHGGKSKKEDKPFETSIYGWERETLSASQLAGWLENVPNKVPVIMVMAQCYCGGFSHTIFEQADAQQPIAEGLRCGFFAQRHDLPAAGCRPDISNDREYSSYFWGALAGQSRAGNMIEGVDRDGDGSVSLAEAHIYAVVASETIDIPLRASDALLRVYSQTPQSDSQLCNLTGPIAELLQRAEFVDAAIASSLLSALEISPDTTIEQLQDRIAESRPNRRRGGRGRTSMQGYRNSLGKLKDELLTRWPEFEKMESIGQCAEMGVSLEDIEQEITTWKTFQDFQEMVQSREQQEQARQQAELNQVKLKRLMHTLETIVLSQNLQASATPEIVQRYRTMLDLENSFLTKK
jgi:hypothetical protein